MYRAVLEEVDSFDDAALVAAFDRVEAEERRLCARKAALVSAIERRSIPAISGHSSTAAWVRGRTRGAPGEATAIVRLARLTHEHPVVGEALHDARIGAAHAQPLARARRNPRCGHHLGDVIELFVDDAATSSFDDYQTGVKQWLLLMDPDGARRDDDARHDNRTATVTTIDDGLFVQAHGASAHAIELTEIFERFVEAEFRSDWAACVTDHGEAASVALMARTPAQRRFDAMVAIFRAAASTPADYVYPSPVVNIVVDEATFLAHLAAASTGYRVDRNPVDVFRSGRCETLDGRPVHPDDMIAASLIGHVRRVVYDSASTVIDLGRRQRLFAGSAREAVQLQARSCFHPGCERAVQRCEIDHVVPWAAGGSTSPANGRPACAKHNRWLNHGLPIPHPPNLARAA